MGTKFNNIKPTQEFVNPEKVNCYVQKLKAGEVVEPIKVVEVPDKGQYIIGGHMAPTCCQELLGQTPTTTCTTGMGTLRRYSILTEQ